MKKLLLTGLLLSAATFAQNFDTKLYARGTGGGNGGDRIEQRATIVMNEIGSFFMDAKNQADFKEVDFSLLQEVIKKTRFISTDETLIDSYSHERCLLNNDNKIYINKDCWNQNMSSEKDQYAILFHELLGLIGLETAGEYVPSVYPISSRLEKYVRKIETYGLLNSNFVIPKDSVLLSCYGSKRFLKSSYNAFQLKLIFNTGKKLNISAQKTKVSKFDLFLSKMENNFNPNVERQVKTKSLFVDATFDHLRWTYDDGDNGEIYFNHRTNAIEARFRKKGTRNSAFYINLNDILNSPEGYPKFKVIETKGNNSSEIYDCDAMMVYGDGLLRDSNGHAGYPIMKENRSKIKNYFMNF